MSTTPLNVSESAPLYRFMTLRPPKETTAPPGVIEVMPLTATVAEFITINETGGTAAAKLASMNTALESFLSSANFFKTTGELEAGVSMAPPSEADLAKLYDNIVVRVLTKSNTTEVFKKLVEYARTTAAALNSTTSDKVRIVLPTKLNFSFTGFKGESGTVPGPIDVSNSLERQLGILKGLREARKKNIIAINPDSTVTKRNTAYIPLLQVLGSKSYLTSEAHAVFTSKITDLSDRRSSRQKFPQTDELYSSEDISLKDISDKNMNGVMSQLQFFKDLQGIAQEALGNGVDELKETEKMYDELATNFRDEIPFEESMSLEEAEQQISARIGKIIEEHNKENPGRIYAEIGGVLTDVTRIQYPDGVFDDEEGAVLVDFQNGCHLKFPIQVADLRVIEQQTVGYIPAEIAHINNTQRGERQERVTRRLKRIESDELIINESEITRETDVQSTEKFSLETIASEVQTESQAFNIGTKISGTMGMVTMEVNGGYTNSSSTVATESATQNFAKDVVTKIVDKARNLIRTERRLKTLEEFEETVTHEIDNTQGETKSYVYRWLNKLVRGTLKNYGKRLIIQVDIAHPAHYYLSRATKESSPLILPNDPRKGGLLKPEMIDRSNYISLGNMYNVVLDTPPEAQIMIAEALSATAGESITSKTIPIKKGYRCVSGRFTQWHNNRWPSGKELIFLMGNGVYYNYNGSNRSASSPIWFNNETDLFPISVVSHDQGYIANIEITCEPTAEFFSQWQNKCYQDLIEGYKRMADEANASVTQFNINNPGLSPEKKLALIATELKKDALRKLFRCNPFWVNDKFEVGLEYTPDCCKDSRFAERVRFLETVFDWQNMTYQLHPYFYTNKSQWDKTLNLTDSDPHFEAFLQASYATVHIPVHRNQLKEIAACNFLLNNSIANYETLPQAMQDVIDELASEPIGNFTVGLDGQDLPIPTSVVDLGVFPIPSDLVILECGTQDGVKPKPYPTIPADPATVGIPEQFSPAIIADSCTTSL